MKYVLLYRQNTRGRWQVFGDCVFSNHGAAHDYALGRANWQAFIICRGDEHDIIRTGKGNKR